MTPPSAHTREVTPPRRLAPFDGPSLIGCSPIDNSSIILHFDQPAVYADTPYGACNQVLVTQQLSSTQFPVDGSESWLVVLFDVPGLFGDERDLFSLGYLMAALFDGHRPQAPESFGYFGDEPPPEMSAMIAATTLGRATHIRP